MHFSIFPMLENISDVVEPAMEGSVSLLLRTIFPVESC